MLDLHSNPTLARENELKFDLGFNDGQLGGFKMLSLEAVAAAAASSSDAMTSSLKWWLLG